MRAGWIAGLLLLLAPGLTWAAGGDSLEVPVWSALPFALLLGAIAILPLLAEHWWHSNRNKGIVAFALGIPTAIYLCAIDGQTGGASTHRLVHELQQYSSFILLLLALYVISGGIVVSGDIPAHPIKNTGILAFGGVLANLVGTTGASMLLIRPMLRINSERERKAHIPIFFIFIVSNTGGLLTPLGDPPLFLGFKNGVDFGWTLQLWRDWVLVNTLLLLIFLIWDTRAYKRETKRAIRLDETIIEPIRVRGWGVNVPLIAGVLAVVLLQSDAVGQRVGGLLGVGNVTLGWPAAEVLLVVLTLASLALTPKGLRACNEFSWVPIVEVAVLFIGIFVTMVPAIALLEQHGPKFGIDKPWQYFWLTGLLSSFLDNAPTYLIFGTIAGEGNAMGWLMGNKPDILAAISCGAVFMGANTYIGNGPNFMVKAVAEHAGYKMPSFFGYMAYSFGILVPLFVLLTFIMF